MDIIIKNLHNENKRLKTENKIIVDQYSRRNKVESSRIPQSVSDNQHKENVVHILKAIYNNVTLNEIEVCYCLGQVSSWKVQFLIIKEFSTVSSDLWTDIDWEKYL